MSEKNCIVCQIVGGAIPSEKIYEDNDVIAFLDVNGANPGHCFVVPKEHYPIFEQVPDPMVKKLFSASNKISMAIFDALQVQGTNLFVTNGIEAGQKVAHFMINIVPRKENDGINLQWQPKQMTEEEISTIELKLKEESYNIGVEEKKPAPVFNPPKHEIGDEDNNFKKMRRIP